jgi:hypothetical protein
MANSQTQAFGHRAPSDVPLPDAEALTNHKLTEMISFLFLVIVAIFSIAFHGSRRKQTIVSSASPQDVLAAIERNKAGNHEGSIEFTDMDEMFRHFGVEPDAQP